MKYLQFAFQNGPEDLVVVVDTSSSMGSRDFRPSRLAGAQQAFLALLRRKLRERPGDSVALVQFSTTSRVVQELTPLSTGINALEVAVKSTRADGWTNLRAGLSNAKSLLGRNTDSFCGIGDQLGSFLKDLFQPTTREERCVRPRHRRVLLLTDGVHNTGLSPDPAAENLKAKGITIDVIGIGGSPKTVDEPRLKRIASKNSDESPRYVFISDTAQLIQTFEKLATNIRPFREEAA